MRRRAAGSPGDGGERVQLERAVGRVEGHRAQHLRLPALEHGAAVQRLVQRHLQHAAPSAPPSRTRSLTRRPPPTSQLIFLSSSSARPSQRTSVSKMRSRKVWRRWALKQSTRSAGSPASRSCATAVWRSSASAASRDVLSWLKSLQRDSGLSAGGGGGGAGGGAVRGHAPQDLAYLHGGERAQGERGVGGQLRGRGVGALALAVRAGQPLDGAHHVLRLLRTCTVTRLAVVLVLLQSFHFYGRRLNPREIKLLP